MSCQYIKQESCIRLSYWCALTDVQANKLLFEEDKLSDKIKLKMGK